MVVTTDILSLNQLISESVREFPDLEVLGIPDKNFNYTKYTTTEIDAAASLLANHLRDTGILPGRTKGDSTSRLTVGLLGVSNIDYVIAEFAMYRMGYCVLLLSPNNSPPAIAHLLTVTNASHVIVQDTLLASATAALSHLPDPSQVSIIQQPPYDMFGPDAQAAHPDKTHWDPPLRPDVEHLMPLSIIHSSGSTGFPKAITSTNKAFIGICKINLGLVTLTTLPLYHAYGHWGMLRGWVSKKLLYMFPTGSIPLTSANMIKLLSQATGVEAFNAVPFALKLLAEAKEGLVALGRLKVVTFSGSACPDELGNLLVANGVPLVAHYGLTETGQLMTSLRDFESDGEWNWMRAKSPHVRNNIHEYLRFEPRGSDTYELYVLDGLPGKVMSNQPDGSFATKDLFIKHPTILDAYKYIGRIDDTLVMANGEKTNPIPIELTLRSSPYIAEAIVFGRARTQIGALILPTEAAQHFSYDEFVQRVSPVVALANADAPSHSQLATEALVFLAYGTAIPRADKGSILRARVYNAFEKVIEEAYERLEGETGSEGKKHVKDELEASIVVRDVISKTIERPIDELEDDTDLFTFGLDSLQSARVRNAIQRSVDLGGKKLSINAVFEHPSIAKLARLVLSLSLGKESDELPSSREVVLQLMDKYSHFVHSPSVDANRAKDDGKVIVLTGATGSLGAHVLDQLLADPGVQTVYCLCRADDDASAANRVAASMQARKLSTCFSDTSERVVALAANLSADQLGLDDQRYREIVQRATAVIHIAWPVNFNMNVSSFDAHIRGAVNLMHLALSSPRAEPAQFFFASSISAVLNWTGSDPVPEAVIEDPAVASGMGYAQSKWVVERLCHIAAQKTLMRTTVFRIGQLVGGTTYGIWNESEWISLLFKCTDTIGILPESNGRVSWLPVDYAAKAIVELVFRSPFDTKCTVYNIIHPARVAWSTILDALQTAGVRFKRAPRQDWLKALRASDPDERRNPSRKLLAFYEARFGGKEEKKMIDFCVDKTVGTSQWLREVPAVDEALVSKWVGAWREIGFLHGP